MNQLYHRPLPFQTRQGAILSKGQSRSAPLLSALPIIAIHHKKQEILTIKNNAIVIYGLSTLREKCRITVSNLVRPTAMELCNDDGDQVVVFCASGMCKLLLNFKKKTCEVMWIRSFGDLPGKLSLFREKDLIYYSSNECSSNRTCSLGVVHVSDGKIGTDDLMFQTSDGMIVQRSRKNAEELIIAYPKGISVVSGRGKKKNFNLENALRNGYYNCVVNRVLAMTQDDEGRIYLLLDWLNLSLAISGGFTTSNYLLVSLSNVFSDSSIEEEGNLICCEERCLLFNQYTFRMEFFKYEKKKYLCFFKNELDLVTVSYQEINNGYHLFKSFIYPYVDMLIVCGI
ncbi:predicted protein [Naegleria gruberi]|uniref:Predicted protein n=1 Tax=Naegleria gruberi TaxID=5762 RepID=D2V170_NAEGR|nr:uncharacterized protein NAEGRDRAFT_62780 [Naegleria gruberi]EFC49418.1 predicted protein [Naegleria gruberi]|eukprot:XP_002682162.1 predicted protein [Naegleria gruberi strain NEG-M]